MKLKFWEKDRRTNLEKTMDCVLEEMNGHNATSEDYKRAAESYEILAKAKEKNEAKGRISMDAVVTVGAHLAGLLLIMNYEKADMILTKAWSHVSKLRL